MTTAADAEDDAAAADLLASIDRRLSSLQEWSLVELAQCRGPLSLHAELAGQVNGDLAVVDGLVEDLALLAEQHPSPRRRLDIIEQCSQRSSQLESLRSKVRDATLTSRRRIQASTTSSMRAELFSSNASAQRNPSKQETHASKDDELMSATSNVTDGLRRTRQLMEQELERSVLSTQMLERSSQTLSLTSNQYTSFSDVLSASKKLITALEKADVLDRLLITAALIFFLLVCILIIKRRIIDRGVRAVSLVGRVAGGVGGVATRGAKAMLPQESPSSAKSSGTLIAQSVTTALASASTALASLSATSRSLSSAPLHKAASASTEKLDDAPSMGVSEQVITADVTSLPVTIEAEPANAEITASSEYDHGNSISTSTVAPLEEELMLDDPGQSDDSGATSALATGDAQPCFDAQDTPHHEHITADGAHQPRPREVVFEDADLSPTTDEEELSLLGEADKTIPEQAGDEEDFNVYQPTDDYTDDDVLAVVNHDEL